MNDMNPSRKPARKSKFLSVTRKVMLLGLTAIAALAPQVRAVGVTFYPTVTNVTQLIADINYANTSGGTYTINLQPGTTFFLTSGIGGIAINGGTKAVAVTIIANGDTLDGGLNGRLFSVAQGASLTLDQATLTNGWVDGVNGGAIYNQGTLAVNNSIISGNTAQINNYNELGGFGGAIYNDFGGTVVINSSTLSGNIADVAGGGMFNHGSVMLTDSTISGCIAASAYNTEAGGGIFSDGNLIVIGCAISGNAAWNGFGGAIQNLGTATISNTAVYNNSASFYDEVDGNDIITPAAGGGIYNSGTLTVESDSQITGNSYDDVYNLNFGGLQLDGTSTIGVLDGHSAIGLNPPLSIHSWSFTAHQLVLSWSTNYTGFTLQSSTDPGSTNWTNCASATVSGASFVVTNSMSTGAQFFRLKK